MGSSRSVSDPPVGLGALTKGALRLERLQLHSRADRLRFYAAAQSCHRGDPDFRPEFRRDALYWIDPEGSPALQRTATLALCAWRGAELVGRVLALRPPGAAEGWFAAFACREDPAAAAALFDRALRWLRELGCTQVRGPVALGVHDEGGVPTPEALSHRPPQGRLLEAAGLRPSIELAALRWSLDAHDPRLARFLAQAARIEGRAGITVRTADLRHLEHELPGWQGVARGLDPTRVGLAGALNSVSLWRELARTALPESVLFAERAGQTLGVAVAAPDVSHLRTTDGSAGPLTLWRLLRGRQHAPRARLRVLTAAPQAQGLGVEEALLAETARRALLRGWHGIDLVEVPLDDHALLAAARGAGASLCRSATVYGAAL